MATNRSPKGNTIRPVGDWYTDRAATVGGAYNPSASVAAVLDLYNNASDGSNLHVYKIFVGNDAAGWYGITQLSGHGGNHVADGFPVVIGGPQLPGQLYQDTISPQWSGGPGFPVDTAFGDVLFMDNEAGSMDVWSAPGPIKVIPLGYSLRVYAFTSSTFSAGQLMVASFYYLALPDRG